MGSGKMDTIHFPCYFIFASAFIKSSHQQQQTLNSTTCGDNFRSPEYSDISVECGTTSIGLAILACPVIYTGYDVSLLIMNGDNNPECRGTLDSTVDPPVMRFSFPLNQTNDCGSTFRTDTASGTGIFSDFSKIQTVNINGVIRSTDLSTGPITYNPELKYFYSCAYPLEYLINNTHIDVSASSIAVKDDNGNFISTLSLKLFSDPGYSIPMNIPSTGIELRTIIYVQVKATHLTPQYNVLLDRCYASTSENPSSTSVFFNLFVSCEIQHPTMMIENGGSQKARFSFEAFRFVEQQNETVSTYFLHCITRLCSSCSEFQCNNQNGNGKRRKRAPDQTGNIDGVTDSTDVTSERITTKPDIQNEGPKRRKRDADQTGTTDNTDADAFDGLSVAVGILALACVVMVGMGFFFYRRLHPGISKVFHSYTAASRPGPDSSW